MGDLLEERQQSAARRLDELKAELGRAKALIGDKACVYVTGSFARGDANAHSDLDLFIVGNGSDEEPALRRLDEIGVKSNLIDATRKLGIPDFSGDGEYLQHYTVDTFLRSVGTRHDDATNTFTARLLLLLESEPLLGEHFHAEVIRKVIDVYWRDYPDHEERFIPGYLANDILRFWRTLCMNYEARTETDPPEEKAKRKLLNYKLKHSRLLTCYSAIAHLLAQYVEAGTVTPGEAIRTVSLSPLERLEDINTRSGFQNAQGEIARLFASYERFLTMTDAPKTTLVNRFGDPEEGRRLLREAHEFGDAMWALLKVVGGDSPFMRLLVV